MLAVLIVGAQCNVTAGAMHNAARMGNLLEATELIMIGVDLYETDEIGWTPLHYAAYGGYADIVKIIIKTDPKTVLTKTPLEGTPIHYAARKGHSDIVLLLMWAAPETLTMRTLGGFTPLCYAAKNGHTKAFKLLVNANPDPIVIESDDGFTPYGYAKMGGHTDIVEFFNSVKNTESTTKNSRISTKELRGMKRKKRHQRQLGICLIPASSSHLQKTHREN